MAIYKTHWFDRWARKKRLITVSLCQAAQEMIAGLYDADLGGGLVKTRIGRPGQGKRGVFRTLVATNKGDRWIFMFGFPKNERANIAKDEEGALKRLAAHLLLLTAPALAKAKAAGELLEVDCHAEEDISDS
jgi:hypothetical protein